MTTKKRTLFLKLISMSMLALLVGCNNNTKDIPKTESSTQTQNALAEIHFIDTGNSDSILIKEGKKAMLIDGADNDDEKTLVQYIKAQDVTELEYVIATHPHADHIGALDSVIQNFPIENLFVANGDAETKTYRDFIQAAMDKNLTPSVPLENQKFMLENSYFEVFNTNGGEDTNEQSLVVLYTNGEDKILLTGDAEKETEAEILSQMPEVDLLKVGHHGSHSSTTDAFLERVNPKYAIITAGVGNQYGHPHLETVEKLKNAHIEVHRTDECGDIIFQSTGSGLTTTCTPGSYERGNQTAPSKPSSSQNQNASKPDTQTNESTLSQSAATHSSPIEIVYWTPKGKSYHASNACSALTKSKTILSGTLNESGKNDPCDRCYN